MKLSEAIRLGSLLSVHHQYGPPVDYRLPVGLPSACVMGTVGLVFGHVFDDSCKNEDWVCTQWPWLNEAATCPVHEAHAAHSRRRAISIIVYCLNDREGWTREQIAAWVVTVEPAETAEQVRQMTFGRTVYVKFTCVHCGSRQTSNTPNVIHTSYTCEECTGITALDDLKRDGINFLLIM